MMSTEKYPALLRLMHWLMAIFLLGNIACGWYMASLSRDISYKFDFYPWHKSFGLLLLCLIFLRIIIRFAGKTPKPPSSLSVYERVGSRLVHFLLYVFMLLVPLSGYLMSSAGGKDLFMFGLPVPGLLAANPDLAGQIHAIHIFIPYILLALIALHVLATLKHRLFDRSGNTILQRMI